LSAPREGLKMGQLKHFIDGDAATYYGTQFASLCFPASHKNRTYYQASNGRDVIVIQAGLVPQMTKTGKVRKDKLGKIKYEKQVVPSGIIPRRIFIYMSHYWQIHKNDENKIDFGVCFADFLKKLGISKGGNTYKQYMKELQRLIFSKVGFYRFDDGHVEYVPEDLIKKAELWWDTDNQDQLSLFNSYVIISDTLKRILEKSMPISLDAVIRIGRDVLAFDLYTWLVCRSYGNDKKVIVDFDSLHEQLGAEYGRKRDFKGKLIEAFKKVKEVYPENKSELTDKGIKLIPSPTHIKSSRKKDRQISF